MTDKTITLGGRTFTKLCEGATVEHDIWFMGQVTRAGLNRVTMHQNETSQDFALRLLETALMSGLVMELLGGLLLPEGAGPLDWTPKMAEETGEFIGHLTDDEDKAKVQRLIVSLLLDFFRTGLTSLYRIRTFSGEGQPASGE